MKPCACLNVVLETWAFPEDVWSVCVTSMTTEILKTQVSLKTSKM